MKKILITGFEPFGGDKINASFEAVKLLKDSYGDISVIKEVLPVTFEESIVELEKYILKHNPDVIICTGYAGGRFGMTIERVGINLIDARIPDNNGYQPHAGKVFEDGDNAYFSSLPVKRMLRSMQKAGVPSALSTTAGTYVCNYVMYGLLYLLEKKYPNKKGVFIHVPFMPEQVVNRPNTPSLSIVDMAKALEACLPACFEKELEEGLGETH